MILTQIQFLPFIHLVQLIRSKLWSKSPIKMYLCHWYYLFDLATIAGYRFQPGSLYEALVLFSDSIVYDILNFRMRSSDSRQHHIICGLINIEKCFPIIWLLTSVKSSRNEPHVFNYQQLLFYMNWNEIHNLILAIVANTM